MGLVGVVVCVEAVSEGRNSQSAAKDVTVARMIAMEVNGAKLTSCCVLD